MIKEKKDLSDWLIASDIDGTLNNKLRKLPQRNYIAIHKYVDDFKGNFILSSGRSVASMRKHFKRLNIKSGYAVFINGAGIYDYNNEEVIWLSALDKNLEETIKKASKMFRSLSLRLQVHTMNEVYLVKPSIASTILAASSKNKRICLRSTSDLPTENWCKVIFTGTPWMINKVERYFKECLGSDAKNLMKSSVCSFEVVSDSTNKGVAVLKAAELLGIDQSHTAAIGDYFNDYQMLKSVAVPACCGQAPKKMKEIAKLVTCHCNKGAVADLIEYLIDKYAE